MKLFLALLTIVKVHAQRSGQACECPTTHDGAADSPEQLLISYRVRVPCRGSGQLTTAAARPGCGDSLDIPCEDNSAGGFFAGEHACNAQIGMDCK